MHRNNQHSLNGSGRSVNDQIKSASTTYFHTLNNKIIVHTNTYTHRVSIVLQPFLVCQQFWQPIFVELYSDKWSLIHKKYVYFNKVDTQYQGVISFWNVHISTYTCFWSMWNGKVLVSSHYISDIFASFNNA